MSQQDSSTFKSLMIMVGAFFALMIVLILIANGISSESKQEAATDKDPMVQAAIEARIKPFGEVNAGDVAKTAAAGGAAGGGAQLSGKEIVKATCFACHGTGALGAPKIGNKADWAPRIKKGVAVLLKHAEEGFNAMPARGGHPSYTNDDLKRAIAYMLEQVGVKNAFGAETAAKPAAKSGASKAAAGGAVDLAKGKEVYQKTCFACHGTGALGAPKLGDKAAWAPRIATGMETLYKAAIHGLRAMPAKGGNPALSDQEVKDAVAYMVQNSK